jgi:ATP-dependent protease ClpP protease subunit
MDWLKITNKAGNEVTIDIDGVIGGDYYNEGVTADNVKKDLKAISDSLSDKITQINVNIMNSPGGSLDHAFGIYDLLTTHEAKVVVTGMGTVASAATVIFAAGTKGSRSLSANAMFLIHRAMNGAWGNEYALQESLDTLKAWESRIFAIYEKAFGISKEDSLAAMDVNRGNGEWWTADQTVEKGFADKIMETHRIAAMVKPEWITNYRLPELPENKQPTNTPKIDNMKKFIMSNFPRIANILNLSGEVEITEDHLKTTEAKIVEIENSVTAMTAERDTAIAARDTAATNLTTVTGERDAANTKVNDLTAKVTALEAENARLKAGQTKTEDKDDPSLADKTAAAQAEVDAKNMREA